MFHRITADGVFCYPNGGYTENSSCVTGIPISLRMGISMAFDHEEIRNFTNLFIGGHYQREFPECKQSLDVRKPYSPFRISMFDDCEGRIGE